MFFMTGPARIGLPPTRYRMSSLEKLTRLQSQKASLVCVGLDPDIDRMPPHLTAGTPPADAIMAFNRAVIDATAPFASAFKINFAFYERYGAAGWRALEETRSMLPEDVYAIADAKRGDIGNSAAFYARSIFETLRFDACTVAPYMGMDSIEPFLGYEEGLAFVLARTSNPGAANLQELRLNGSLLYEHLIDRLMELPAERLERTGLVVGATGGEALGRIRTKAPALPFLIPGIGAQGGDLAGVLQAAYAGPGSLVIASSRAILYADTGEGFAEAAAAEARRLREEIRRGIEPG